MFLLKLPKNLRATVIFPLINCKVGLIENALPKNAESPLHLPPLYKKSSVLIIKEACTSFFRASIVSTICGASSPLSRKSAAASASSPVPDDKDRPSTT